MLQICSCPSAMDRCSMHDEGDLQQTGYGDGSCTNRAHPAPGCPQWTSPQSKVWKEVYPWFQSGSSPPHPSAPFSPVDFADWRNGQASTSRAAEQHVRGEGIPWAGNFRTLQGGVALPCLLGSNRALTPRLKSLGRHRNPTDTAQDRGGDVRLSHEGLMHHLGRRGNSSN